MNLPSAILMVIFFLTSFPPGPPSLPLIHGLYARGWDSTELPWRYAKFAKTYGPVFSLQLPNRRYTIKRYFEFLLNSRPLQIIMKIVPLVFYRWIVVLNDISSIKEAFIQRGNDVAGRPFKDHYKVCSSMMNPQYPKAGAFNFNNIY